MAKTPEGRVKDEVKKALQAEGLALFADFIAGRAPSGMTGFFFMPVAGPFSVLGIHDFVGCWHGVFWSMETKAPDSREDATFHQEQFRAATTTAGGVSIVGVRSAAAVAELKRRVMEVARGRREVA